jgi:hypothetical protein
LLTQKEDHGRMLNKKPGYRTGTMGSHLRSMCVYEFVSVYMEKLWLCKNMCVYVNMCVCEREREREREEFNKPSTVIISG